jgi:uncharacterized protein (TIGR00725 family)
MTRSLIIAVIGDSRVQPGDERDRFAESIGRLIVDRGWRVQTGGLGGVMEAACRGARSSSRWTHGSTIGLLPGWDVADANPFVDVPIPTGLDHGRNLLVVQADAVVAIGGGAGTLSELALAWMLFRLVIAKRGEGWSGRLADQRVDDRVRYPAVADDRVYGVAAPEEAIALIERLLPAYGRRHNGVRRRADAK